MSLRFGVGIYHAMRRLTAPPLLALVCAVHAAVTDDKRDVPRWLLPYVDAALGRRARAIGIPLGITPAPGESGGAYADRVFSGLARGHDFELPQSELLR